MEVDANLVFAGVSACAVIGGAVMAYGELKTKVVGLTQRADSSQKSREKMFERIGELEQETVLQKNQIVDLRGNSDKLFQLHEKQAEISQRLATTMEALSTDVHYIRDYVKAQRGQ